MTERKVEFQSGTYKLVGIINELGNPPNTPIVLYAHGISRDSNMNSSKIAGLRDVVEKSGIATFRFDFYGRGQSEGSPDDIHFPPNDYAVTMWQSNMRSALDFVKSIGYRKFGMTGSSFGAKIVALAASYYTEGVNAIVLRAPLVRPGTHAFERAAYITAPTLVVRSEFDEIASEEETKTFFNQVGSYIKELKTILGADHGCDNPEHEKQFINFSAEWFEKYLLSES